MKNIEIGLKASVSEVVEDSMLAVNVGSGSLEVFATPIMAMLMEKASCRCVVQCMENDETTVGTSLDIEHISATPKGMKVTVESEVVEVNGREIVFKVTAYDKKGMIGNGTHKRFMVYGEKFLAKTQSKLS